MNLSVVVATYNRARLVRRLLLQLAAQTVPDGQFEVVVVDDGSSPPVWEDLRDLDPPYPLRVIRQENRGAGAARHAGVVAARGEVIVIVDDDMQIGCHFLEHHLRAHAGGRAVVLGRIAADPAISSMPLFERWHAQKLDRKADALRSGALLPKGYLFFTGNVSFRRDDYLEVGGFDASLPQSEDIELGLRLEKAGVAFRFCEAARTTHGSDHTSMTRWRARARLYGWCDCRIAAKHPELRDASPWRFVFDLHPLARPFIAATLFAPRSASAVAGAALCVAAVLGWIGAERAAIAGASLAYVVEYFRGVREHAGSRRHAFRALANFEALFERSATSTRAAVALTS
jgi:glycosyltransferase involved in cell wall biosynthesis